MGHDDPRRPASRPELVERIHDEIEASSDRRITFARFMERALTEPGLGYYAASDLRPTRAGDFLTAAELHPFFGRCLGRFLVSAMARLGEDGQLAVTEYGAGRGRLETDVRAGLAADGEMLADRLVWHGVDLPGRSVDRPGGPFEGVVIANEFLDALPVHRLVVIEGELRERWVTWGQGWFADAVAPLSNPAVAADVLAAGIELAEGQELETRPAATTWLADVASRLGHGLVLVIDYGHPAAELYGPRRRAGTLVTYRDHVAGDDPYDAVGRQDLTAHVDLSALERAADAAGLVSAGSTDQARFLERLGLGALLDDLGHDRATGMADYAAARGAVLRLIDPRHLGGFRVLAWERTPNGSDRPALRGLADT